MLWVCWVFLCLRQWLISSSQTLFSGCQAETSWSYALKIPTIHQLLRAHWFYWRTSWWDIFRYLHSFWDQVSKGRFFERAESPAQPGSLVLLPVATAGTLKTADCCLRLKYSWKWHLTHQHASRGGREFMYLLVCCWSSLFCRLWAAGGKRCRPGHTETHGIYML